MCRKRQSPALSDYLRLIEEFLSHRLAATDFERMYLRMFKEDSTIRPDQQYEVLNALFAAAEAFCDDPSIAGTGALDEDGFRAEAMRALEALHRLSRSAA
jgi:self-protective colicin-like immunity protein